MSVAIQIRDGEPHVFDDAKATLMAQTIRSQTVLHSVRPVDHAAANTMAAIIENRVQQADESPISISHPPDLELLYRYLAVTDDATLEQLRSDVERALEPSQGT